MSIQEVQVFDAYERYTFDKFARQAAGSVWFEEGKNTVLATVTIDEHEEVEEGFLPLIVQYIEKSYAAGKFPGGFVKREQKPTEAESLIARLVDRTLRPLFPRDFKAPVVITIMVYSVDNEVDLALLAVKAASAALFSSAIPIDKSVSGIRVAKDKDGALVFNPSDNVLRNSTLNLFVAGNSDGVLMIEMNAKGSNKLMDIVPNYNEPIEACMAQNFIRQDNAMNEEELIEILKVVNEHIKTQNIQYETLFTPFKKPHLAVEPKQTKDLQPLESFIQERYADEIKSAISRMAKSERLSETVKISKIISQDSVVIDGDFNAKEVQTCVEKLKSHMIREMILKDKVRPDGRSVDEVRKIDIETNILPRPHSSVLFNRGQTQALVSLTLGGEFDAQIYDELTSNSSKSEDFMLHYNFPSFSVGESERLGPPSRRELGHGVLAKKAIECTLVKDKSLTVRLVSEILESNGSSSMATVCAGSLALVAADLEVTNLVAGVAMGLVKQEEEYKILTDIIALEDHEGDMDFKVAGTHDGITAMQLDIKMGHLDFNILKQTLQKSAQAKKHILNLMEKAKEQIKLNEEVLPQIENFFINPEAIISIIGTAGKRIKEIVKTFGVNIDLDKSNGNVRITGQKNQTARAKEHIETIANKEAKSFKAGEELEGTVVKKTPFGALVEFDEGGDGMIHISKLSSMRIEKVEDVVKVGDSVRVKVLSQRGRKTELQLIEKK